MSRRTTRENQAAELPLTSGAVGGPGTARLAFQVDNAVWHALNMISEASCRALDDSYVTIEPRVISSLGVTAWDIRLEPNDENIEVKFNASRKDVEEWLDRIGKASPGAPLRRFTLVYNKGGNALINGVEDLRRIATECRDDGEKFRFLVAGEQISDAEEVLTRLGTDAHLTLQRMKTDHLPDSVLQKNIGIITRLLAGTEADKLYRILYDNMSHGVAGRIKFAIKDLIHEAEQNQISLFLPPARLPVEADPLFAALFLLQSCVTGLPIEIVAYAVDSDGESLKRAFKTLVQDGRIVEEGNRWFTLPQSHTLIHPNGKEILARALDELLRFIKTHDNDEHAFAQIHNAVSLAKQCAVVRPQSVIPVFPILDKPLKRIGDIHFVLEVAELSISAAQRVDVDSRTRDEAAAFALSLVCGVSWAYQRMPGHLDDARSAYLRSRSIAEGIDDKVTLAFISKCLGRLCRMEAEVVNLSREIRDSKLRESVQLLHDAIERFEELSDFARSTHEVADSYSLLARTYLVMRESDKVEEALRSAFSRTENLHSQGIRGLANFER